MENDRFEILKELQPLINNIKHAIYLLKKNKLTMTAVIVSIFIIIIGIIAPYIVPYPRHVIGDADPEFKLLPPGGKYILGTDELGRDIFSRIIYGTRIFANRCFGGRSFPLDRSASWSHCGI